jgi:hypothetical protein
MSKSNKKNTMKNADGPLHLVHVIQTADGGSGPTGNEVPHARFSTAGWRHKTRFEGSVLNIRIDLSQSGDSMQHESGTVS